MAMSPIVTLTKNWLIDFAGECSHQHEKLSKFISSYRLGSREELEHDKRTAATHLPGCCDARLGSSRKAPTCNILKIL